MDIMSDRWGDLALVMGLLSAGLVLGVFFYGGLWWTVRRGLVAAHPAAWFFFSLLLRLAVVLTGLLWLVAQQPWRLWPCLGGMILGRLLVTRFIPRADEVQREGDHAPESR